MTLTQRAPPPLHYPGSARPVSRWRPVSRRVGDDELLCSLALCEEANATCCWMREVVALTLPAWFLWVSPYHTTAADDYEFWLHLDVIHAATLPRMKKKEVPSILKLYLLFIILL